MPFTAGDKLGPYEILAPIGTGGMGEVYRAKDPKLGRHVAIKVLPGHLAADVSARERLHLEAIAAAALDHPFICKVFEIGEVDGVLFLVMEFICRGHALSPLALRQFAAARKHSASPAKWPKPWRKPTTSSSFIAISSPPT